MFSMDQGGGKRRADSGQAVASLPITDCGDWATDALVRLDNPITRTVAMEFVVDPARIGTN